MKRFRYEWVAAGDLSAVNLALAQGWRPVRETNLPSRTAAEAEEASGTGGVLVLLERDDAFPAFRGEMVYDGIPFEALEQVPLLHGLNEEELREIAAACEWRRYAAGQALFDVGQAERRLYVVLEGEVSIRLMGLPIDDPVMLQAKPQDAFGESNFFGSDVHSTRAEATTAVLTLELTRARFDELLQGRRLSALKLSLNAAYLLGQRLHLTDQWVRDILQQGQAAESIMNWHRFRHGMQKGSEYHGGSSFSWL